ncbi:hypothetical protein [Cognatiluteimonas lumbrici]|uniref:hypothetical protein n=1 Tax=Cognatiluteimonas lumbrici TaxID=2559601 RepID=UPI00112DFB28|nr:hypothetical protein [Luteimonas lumbrici]
MAVQDKGWRPWAIAIVAALAPEFASWIAKPLSPWIWATIQTDLSIPASVVIGLCIYGAGLSLMYWNETAPGRKRLRMLRATGKGIYHQPTWFEERVIHFMRLVDGPVEKGKFVRVIADELAKSGKPVARRDIEVAFDQLIGAGWIEYAGEFGFELSAVATEYCRKKKIQTMRQMQAENPSSER